MMRQKDADCRNLPLVRFSVVELRTIWLEGKPNKKLNKPSLAAHLGVSQHAGPLLVQKPTKLGGCSEKPPQMSAPLRAKP